MVKTLGAWLGPLVFVLLSFFRPESLEAPAWFVILTAAWMLTWWLTEAVPIAVTALLPIVVFPLTGVLSIREACGAYGHHLVFLFLGGFVLALAIEKWQLHRRIALNIIRATGTRANRIILGFMLASALLSMWISNTATTVMMLPIATSVIAVLMTNNTGITDKQRKVFALTIMLGIAYAANIGGIATLIGTPPNLAMVGVMEESYNQSISFIHWMVLATPVSVMLLGLTFVVLTRVIYRSRIGRFEGAGEVIRGEIRKLGKLAGGERRVLLIFSVVALLWISRGMIESALESFLQAYNVSITDTGIAIAGAILMFLIPSGRVRQGSLLEWSDTRNLPWGILLLFGGGLALAAAFKSTGLVEVIAERFQHLASLEQWIFILILTAVALFLTELMSNLALVQIFVPVVAEVAIELGFAPLAFAVPVTMAASCAFMFPMSTPPNAIVFASGHVRIPEMTRAGVFLNLIAILVIAAVAVLFLDHWLAVLG